MTNLPVLRDAWLEERRKGIGGSDVAAILGVSPWGTRYTVWADKRGLSDAKPETPAMRWGNLLEPAVLAEYASQTGRTLFPGGHIHRHPEHPFLLGTLDAFTSLKDGRPCIVEAKTTARADGWGEAGSADIPLHYACQVQHYMAVCGFPVAHVCVLIGGSDFRVYEIPAAPKTYAQHIIPALRDFWALVKAGTPPPITDPADLNAHAARLDLHEALTAPEDLTPELYRLAEVQASIKALEAEEAVITGAVKAELLAANADRLVDAEGGKLATWSLSSGRSGIDTDRLAQDFPDAYAACLKSAKPYRTLRFNLKGLSQ